MARESNSTDIFAAELEHAIRIVAALPAAGTAYPDAGMPGLRRIFLRKVACHLYTRLTSAMSSSAHSGVRDASTALNLIRCSSRPPNDPVLPRGTRRPRTGG